MAYGKSIELFLVNGTADSLITAELSNWNGKAIKIPRIEVPGCARDDTTQPGVYFLFCKDEIKDYVVQEDLLFSSSSAAADFVLGYSVSGPKTWKLKDGRSLKEIESEEAGEEVTRD